MLPTNHEFWYNPLPKLLKDLTTTPKGLLQKEVRNRLKIFGPNEISTTKERTVFYQLLRRLKNPLVILLLLTSLVSLLLKQTSDFFIIIVMVFMSVALDFFQEYTANQAAKKLRDSITLKAKVLREGSLRVIPVKELVPGDVVYLKAGDMIPADGRLIWENHLGAVLDN